MDFINKLSFHLTVNCSGGDTTPIAGNPRIIITTGDGETRLTIKPRSEEDLFTGEEDNRIRFRIQCKTSGIHDNIYKFYIGDTFDIISETKFDERPEEERELFCSLKDGTPMKIQQEK